VLKGKMQSKSYQKLAPSVCRDVKQNHLLITYISKAALMALGFILLGS
jgi:hypothetical protein